MTVRGLVEREGGTGSYVLTDQGRAVGRGVAWGTLIQQAAGADWVPAFRGIGRELMRQIGTA